MEMDETARDAAISRKLDESAPVLNALLLRATRRKLYVQVNVTEIELKDHEAPACMVRVRLEKG